MSTGATLLIVAVIVLAAVLVAHVALVVRIVGTADVSSRERWMSLLPIFTPFIGWRASMKRHVWLWASLIGVYALLRIALSLR